MGNPLGNVHDNVGHSNVRFGFRLFTLAARTYPCLPIRNNSDPNDPWQYNPSILSKFSNFTLYKNGESGALVENSGNCVFDNFTIAESVISSATFHTSNMTKEKTTLSNSVLIGMSTQVHDNNSSKYNGKGIISPRAGDLVLSHVNFYSFGERQTILSTCTDCGNLLLLDTVGQYIFTDNLKFTNILGHYLTMQGIKREIIYDKDGTFAS